MISQEQIQQLKVGLKRVFGLPISKMTLREVQNLVSTVFQNDSDTARLMMDSLLRGELNEALENGDNEQLISLLEDFSWNIRQAKEVFDLGEFMNIFSCDFLQQGNQVYFVNRMRRIDGQEYYFFSAPETNIRLAHMFINRLKDLKKAVGNLPLDPRLLQELENLTKDVNELVGK